MRFGTIYLGVWFAFRSTVVTFKFNPRKWSVGMDFGCCWLVKLGPIRIDSFCAVATKNLGDL